MPFVKLDCGILRSTIWFDKPAREVFLTALLMAEPKEVISPEPTIKIRSLDRDEFVVHSGWYGFVPAASTGIIRYSGVDESEGLDALERLAAPEPSSRTPDFDGRRLVRIEGGFIVLNFQKYRDRDYTNADRQARFRARHKSKDNGVMPRNNPVTITRVTQAEAEAEAEVEEEKKEKKTPRRSFVAPSVVEISDFIKVKGYGFDGEAFHAFYESKGWKVGGQPMRNWRAACVTWEKRHAPATNRPTVGQTSETYTAEQIEAFRKQVAEAEASLPPEQRRVTGLSR